MITKDQEPGTAPSPMPTSHKESEAIVSNFLSKIVSQGLIPEKIAVIFNQLPTATLQAEALNRLRIKVPELAQSIVNEIKNTPSESNNFSHDVLPWWLFYPYSGNLKNFIKKAAIKVKSDTKNVFLPLHRFLKGEATSFPKQRIAKYLSLFIGLYVVILGFLKLSDMIAQRAVIIRHDETAAIATTPSPTEQEKTSLGETADAPVRKAKREPEKVSESSVPQGMRYHRISKGKYQLRWPTMGPDIRYHVYSSPEGNVNDIRRINSGALSKPEFEWTTEPGDYVITVTGIGQDGHQGDPSSPLHIKIR